MIKTILLQKIQMKNLITLSEFIVKTTEKFPQHKLFFDENFD